MELDVKLNNYYLKEEIEKIFNTNFGARIKGINLRIWDGTIPYIILFSRVDGPYFDNISGNFFYYEGEGLEGDQHLTAANKALTNANAEDRTIYVFRQEEAGGKWKYIGISKVINYDYVQKNGRKVYVFKLQQSNIESISAINEEEIKIEQTSLLPEPSLEEERRITISTLSRTIRDEAFRRKIKKIYGDTCVVCRKKRYTNANYPEVQSAHIYPVERNGPDDLRNGIALCRLHHWAFDGGLFTINDNFVIKVKQNLLEDNNYDEISRFDNKMILLPTEDQFKPIPLFLKQHRIIHGFEY